MGDRFRFDEVEPFVTRALPGARVRVFRFDHEHVYVDLAVVDLARA